MENLADNLIGINPDIVFSLGGLDITNSMIGGVVVTLVITIFSLYIYFTNRLENPGRIQIVTEMILEFLIGSTSQITGNRKLSMKILPWVGSVVIYITVANLITLIPGLTSLIDKKNEVDIIRTNTSDFNTTFSIAVTLLLTIQIYTILQVGPFRYINRYFRIGTIITGFRNGLGSGFIAIIEFLVGLLDIISEFAKSISLSLRLFGNVFAGEVLVAVLAAIMPVILPIPLVFLSILTGILQAIVFGNLIASYFSTALAEE